MIVYGYDIFIPIYSAVAVAMTDWAEKCRIRSSNNSVTSVCRFGSLIRLYFCDSG